MSKRADLLIYDEWPVEPKRSLFSLSSDLHIALPAGRPSHPRVVIVSSTRDTSMCMEVYWINQLAKAAIYEDFQHRSADLQRRQRAFAKPGSSGPVAPSGSPRKPAKRRC